MNIFLRLSLLTIVLVITSSAVLFYFTDSQVKKTLESEITSNITQQSQQSVENIQRFIFSRLNDVRMTAKNPYFRITDISRAELTNRLLELEELNNLYNNFSFYNMERIRLADSRQVAIGEQHSESSFWLKLKEDEAAMDIAISESTNEPVMNFASKVRDFYTNEPIGVIVGTIKVDELYKLMGDFSLSSEASRKLNVNWIDDSGLLLYSNENPDQILNAKYDQFDLVKNVNSIGVNKVASETDLIYVTRDTGFLEYTGSGWKLVLSIGKDEAFLPLTRLREQLIVVIGGALIFSLIVSFVVARVFVKPIVMLSHAAEEIGKGNLDTEITVNRKDEIGQLAKNLQMTTRTLIERIDEQKELNVKLQDQKKFIESQKAEMEAIYREVNDSINYSKRIQSSILPDPDQLKRVFKDKLLIFKPKDVVSGDFYWFERVRTGRKEHMIVVAADCTGHGVPGAIMSMVGSNQLTSIVYYQNYIEPQKILARLDKNIKFEIYRDMDTDQPRHDGMEVGVCVIDLDTLEMSFAGAAFPLYFIRNGEIEIFKSPRVTIGRMEGTTEKEVEDQFTVENIQLQKGDRVFMASDGFQDQFGGPSDKRFMAKNFRNLLLVSGQDKTLGDQEKKMNQVFDHWKGNADQTDDVLILGFEV